MTSTRKDLHKFQKTGLFVFHGTPVKVKDLNPRQAYNYVKGVRTRDGKPAVFATPFVDLAIFRAVVNRKNCPSNYRSGFSYRNKKLGFRASKFTLDQLNNSSKGYVYIFKKHDFMKSNPCESVAFKKVMPFKLVKVTSKDLPSKIFIIKGGK
ncbi:MAG: hypothetical protein UV57_C0009G0024 [Parcubacteria group bacterium GW2011_GWD2_43_10]|nr:MAG: hypothetical protein UV57_C0009G0024 [Parcubacteria group bacterium GW2011_GWD2_43_10]